ncbi:MAG: glycoside hydrolase family 16 protein [Coprobacillus sp.]|nr:glycoside hydrolase family 16 protein [Coprobacillus sp.]
MKKVNKNIWSLALSALLLCGCSGSSTTQNSVIEFGDTDYYSTIEDRVSFNYNDERNIDEHFEGGMDDSKWYALEGAWHNTDSTAPHNGMKHRNLYYTETPSGSTYLAIKGKGYYYTGDDFEYNKPEGGCIISKDHLGPGRYEIEMAALPREGAVSAMWTYCTTTGNEATSQNEIDIELGGTTNGTQFENLWSTTWTKQSVKDTDTIDVTDYLYTNDGQIHKYTFDWYTNYQGTGEKRVDWFIDGIFMDSITGNAVPEYDTPLWIGVWFPPLWAGNPSFVEDYMVVKSVTYTAFENRQWYDECKAGAGYNKVDPSSLDFQTIPWETVRDVEKLGNSHLDNLEQAPRDGSYYGWAEESASKGEVSLVDGESDKAIKLTASDNTSESIHGEYLKQTISNAFDGYKYHLTGSAKLEDSASSGNIEIRFLNKSGSSISNSKIDIPIESYEEYQKIDIQLSVPTGAKSLTIGLTAEEGSVIYDEMSLIFEAGVPNISI